MPLSNILIQPYHHKDTPHISNPFSYHHRLTIKLTEIGCFCRNIGLELYYYTIHKTTACIITFFNDNCKQWFARGYFPKKMVLVLWMILVAGYVNIAYAVIFNNVVGLFRLVYFYVLHSLCAHSNIFTKYLSMIWFV